jgi:serine/threonine protein kinase
VGDFGLARILEAGESQLVTTTCGTITYMPLERVQENVLTKATDVYSFGVLCWEVRGGRQAAVSTA